MSYVLAEARQELIDSVAEAAQDLGKALAAVGEAYEALDEQSADRLEEALFRPLQQCLAGATRTAQAFARRVGLPDPSIVPGAAGPPSRGVKGHLEDAEESVRMAEAILTELQDSLSPVEVGDAELRAGLADVRARMEPLPARAEQFISRFGR